MTSGSNRYGYENVDRIAIQFSDIGIKNAVTLGRLNYSSARKPLPMHTHENAMEICYLARGSQTYVVENEKYDITGGDVFITYPNEYHGTGLNPEEKSMLYWLIIDFSDTADFLNYPQQDSRELLASILAMKERVFHGKSSLKEILEKIFQIYFTGQPFARIMIRNLVTEFLVSIISLEKTGHEHSISPVIAAVMDYIDRNVKKDIELKELAALSNLSLSRFKQKFKDETGIPPKEYIIRKKVEMSKALIKDTDMCITDIAYELNFSSSQYFATAYKRITGKNPSDCKRH